MKNLITIDSTFCVSELCKLGKKYPTDKSPINQAPDLHKHAYTAIYNLLFAHLKHKKINIAEIGIFHNMSIHCLREFFENSTIHGYEYNTSLIENAKLANLRDVSYMQINVSSKDNIINAFENSKTNYDIIIDDSTHEPQHQLNVIECCMKYLNSGGYMIIEDIFKNLDTSIFESVLDNMPQVAHYVFINADHENKFSGTWDNDRILIIIKGNDK
jgi:predicted O-methyltransferase YrrM